MAKLSQMPALWVIDAFRGVVDFYQWCGLVIARKWPRAPVAPRSPGVQATGNQFAYVNKQSSTLDETVRPFYEEMALGTALTWKDFMVRLYTKGAAWWAQS